MNSYFCFSLRWATRGPVTCQHREARCMLSWLSRPWLLTITTWWLLVRQSSTISGPFAYLWSSDVFVQIGVSSEANCHIRRLFHQRKNVEEISSPSNCASRIVHPIISPSPSRWLLENARKFNYDVTIQNFTDHVATLGLAGPKSRDVLLKLTSVDLTDLFKDSGCQELDIGGLPVRVTKFSYTGEWGSVRIVCFVYCNPFPPKLKKYILPNF